MRWVLAVLVAAAVSACGSTGDDDEASDGAGQGGNAGKAGSGGGSGETGAAGDPGSGGTSGSSSGGTSGSGGSGGHGGGAGTSGSAGTPMADCTGTFGDPTLVMDGAGMRLGSLTLRADELELIYEDRPMDETAPHHYRRSLRASKDELFPPGEELAVLDAACDDPTWTRSGDLSNDGLRLYFACYETLAAEPQPIRVARRKTLDAPFVLDEATYGTSRSGIAIDSDELMIVTSPSVEAGPLYAHTRATTSDVFGPELTLVGLDGLLTPDLSSDGQHLFASRYTDVNRNSLVTADRTGPTTFSTALTIRQLDEVEVVGSPSISADCRSLYYVSVVAGPEFSIMVLRR